MFRGIPIGSLLTIGAAALVLVDASHAESGASAEVKLDANKVLEQAGGWLNDKFKDSNKYRDRDDMWLFFEGNNCSQNIVGSMYPSKNGQARMNVKKISWFKNDEARSVLIQKGRAGETLFVFDNPNGKRNDDWAAVHIRKSFEGHYCVGTFEVDSYRDAIVEQVFRRKNGLDGKISHVRNTQ